MMLSYASTFVVIFFTCSLAFPGWNRPQQREVCYETDFLLAFEEYRSDSVPYCSSLLNILDSTTFVGPAKSHTYAQLNPDCARY